MNALIAIHPYKYRGFWVFDDPAVGLVQEPFVAGADVILDRLTAHLPEAASGFRILFSAAPFPGYTVTLSWRREDLGGNWYFCDVLGLEGWLCAALLKYFERPPRVIYAKFEPGAPDAAPRVP